MNEIEKIQDYLKLLKNFEYQNKSSGMQTILTVVGPGKQYLDGWKNYAVLYLKNELELVTKNFSNRADRVYLIEKITSLVENYSDFAEYAHKELSKFYQEAVAFTLEKKFSLQDKQEVDKYLLIISEALEKQKTK